MGVLKMADNQVIGILHSSVLKCVQCKKNDIGENGDYFYNLGFTNGSDMLLVTAGKIGDKIVPFKDYTLHFSWIDKKLKLVGFDEVK